MSDMEQSDLARNFLLSCASSWTGGLKDPLVVSDDTGDEAGLPGHGQPRRVATALDLALIT